MDVMLAGTLVTAGAAAVSAGGFLVVSKFVPDRWLVADSDAASALYATIGMVYAILIAIAAIAVWEPRSAAASSTDLEAGSLVEAYWSTDQLAPVDRSEVRQLIVAYLADATGPEWDRLRIRHEPDDRAELAFTQLRHRVDAVRPQTDPEQNAYAQLSAQISAAAGARSARLQAAGEGMPGLLWPVLLAGGLVSVLFLYLFGLDRTFPNGLMMAVVGAMIALLLFVLYQVEFPFSRAFAVSPDSLLAALAQVRGLP
ncbi:MAG: DUF4239 domain-containing protein [Hamadaea sp.]|uniref:bestrophin-like domain n=1 Tax=Hamadaea sp. TaxID=2024425 RepID=UPI00182A25A1|nr:DUF4239 domain-containing protein [Hamadaea sp.]NUR69992.1 DUF4239 domain-containing protein [Hamadaea sp.]NUT19700.1 DUF4239 domain-containing protein [Hamadaea sp.]